jgi:pimeloyl-ACP methyl ester carboxylesterase
MPTIPLILLPGSLCDAALWHHQIVHLADIAEVHVGEVTRDDSIAGMARTVLAAAPQRFALAGLSMGGIVACEIMRQAPQRVLRLALLDTNPYSPRPERLQSWRHLIVLIEGGRFDEVVKQHLLPSWVHPDRQSDAPLMNTILRMAKAVGPEVYARQLVALMHRPDSFGDLARIACPTLVLVGRQDALCPVGMHQKMAAAIPGADLVVVEQCGHLSSLEQPQAVTATLRYWLQVI